jgi:cytochrome oxidase Cu insertion factor (SCO1/SenC/PrrC family)
MDKKMTTNPKSQDSKPDSPLDLTVTQLPAAQPANASGRWKMFALLAVCASPVIASYFTYYVIRPSNTKSFGELIQPQRPMPTVAAQKLDGTPTNLQSLRGQWLLVSVASAGCDKACEDQLYLQRQLRETLGREKTRLDWVLLVSEEAALAPELKQRLSSEDLLGFQALQLKKSDIQTWLGSDSSRLFLVDPQGDYMMRFPENMTTEQAAKAKSDINRLLRASSFWDTPGRDNVQPAKQSSGKP